MKVKKKIEQGCENKVLKKWRDEEKLKSGGEGE